MTHDSDYDYDQCVGCNGAFPDNELISSGHSPWCKDCFKTSPGEQHKRRVAEERVSPTRPMVLGEGQVWGHRYGAIHHDAAYLEDSKTLQDLVLLCDSAWMGSRDDVVLRALQSGTWVRARKPSLRAGVLQDVAYNAFQFLWARYTLRSRTEQGARSFGRSLWPITDPVPVLLSREEGTVLFNDEGVRVVAALLTRLGVQTAIAAIAPSKDASHTELAIAFKRSDGQWEIHGIEDGRPVPCHSAILVDVSRLHEETKRQVVGFADDRGPMSDEFAEGEAP